MQNAIVSAIMIFGLSLFFFIFKTFNLTVIKFIFLNSNFEPGLFSFSSFHSILTLISILWLLGFFFKMGVFPVFFYIPDIYEGCELLNLLIIVVLIKPACFVLFSKVVVELYFFSSLKSITIIFFSFGLISLIIGNLMAVNSSSIKRFFGYSSIAQYGFSMVFISTNSMLCFALIILQIFVYNFLLIFIFYMIVSFYKNLFTTINFFSELKNIKLTSLKLVFLTTLALLVISGIPPSILFFIKYYLFLELFQFGMAWLLFLMLFLNILNIFYYMWFLKEIWATESDNNSKAWISVIDNTGWNSVKDSSFSMW
jgi:NADH-quinone oxidoreductase subunit N